MIKRVIVILFILSISSCVEDQKQISTIAFGSCNRENIVQSHWKTIIENDPQLWVWLGDNIYGDSDDMSVLANKYLDLLQNPEYRKLLAKCPVIGTWDDHDYGKNDAGKEYEMKKESKKLFMDFLQLSDTSSVSKREGVYQSYTYGVTPNQVKVILLDTRYFRDSMTKNEDGYVYNLTGDILGDEQWQWLEGELTDNSAALTLIGSSIQIIPMDHRYEKWANFPKARERFLNLMEETSAGDIVLMSGDRHIAEISRLSLNNGHDLYEITSSGLTHSSSIAEEQNQHRLGSLINRKNFGLITFSWNTPVPKALFEVKGMDNKVLASLELPLAQ